VLNSLRFRLVASCLLIVVITLAAAGVGLYARLGSYRNQLTTSTLRQVAAPIYYNLTLFAPQASTPRSGQRLRTELLDYLRIQQQESGVIVLLIDKDGAVIREANVDSTLLDEHFDVPPPPSRGPNFSQLPDGTHTTADGRTLLYVTVPVPVLVRGQQPGINAIVVALPESAGPNVYKDLRQRLFFAGAVGMAAAVVAALVLWASLYRPMGKVTRGIRAVARGDYRERVPVSGPGEVRALAQDVNTMSDAVQASQRAVREFLANVSHELRTPLTSIRGFSQAMQDGTLDTPEERTRAARVIDVESRRLLHLVGELMDLSRIESGQQSMNVADVSVAELLQHVREVFSIRAGDAGIELQVQQDGDAIVSADFDRIEQVLGNLMDNAFRHARRGQRVVVGARKAAGNFAELFVSDEGEGIPAPDLPHVFDRFYRSKDEVSGTGAGLGLTISREIVRAHGGEIRAESRPGGGTTFAFTLPLSTGAPPEPKRSPTEPPAAGGTLGLPGATS
jgi:signal transduction histidine kinase